MNYGGLRTPLLELGYMPTPIVPNAKYPAIKGWESVEVPPNGYVDYGVGIVCGTSKAPICGVDIDVLDDAISARMLSYLLDTYGITVYRIGKAPKVLAVYRVAVPGIRKITSENYVVGKVEILSAGQQFVSYGTHPDTKMPYTWPGPFGGIVDVPVTDLPELTEANMVDIVATFEELVEGLGFRPISKDKKKTYEGPASDYDPTNVLDVPPPLNLARDQIIRALRGLSPDCSRDQWRNVGMALHHETGGSDEGLTLWDQWSSTGQKYKEGEPEKQWGSFGKSSSRPLTAAYILKLEKDAAPPAPVVTPRGDTIVARKFFQSIQWSTARFSNNPPPIPMIIEDVLPRGIVGMMFADGGAGKSTIMLYLCAKFALLGKDATFMDYRVNPGKVVIITAEDPDLVLNHRFISVVKAISEELMLDESEVRALVDENLSIVSTFGHRIGLFKLVGEEMHSTDFFESLAESLLAIADLKMVVIDTKTRFSPGEGHGNVTATDEINFYENIAMRTGATVMLLHHTNKASRSGGQTGKTAFRDASAIYDSVRFAWYLRSLTPEEGSSVNIDVTEVRQYLLLECAKNNYKMAHDPIIIHRRGYSYTKHSELLPKSLSERILAKKEDLMRSVMAILQASKGLCWSRADLTKLGRRAGMRPSLFDEGVSLAIESELLVKRKLAHPSRYEFKLTSEGKLYGLDIIPSDATPKEIVDEDE